MLLVTNMEEEEKIHIQDDSGDRKYFSLIPHYILNHSTAIAQALYLQLKRLAGENGVAFPSRGFLMEKLAISKPTLLKELNYLITKGWIIEFGERSVVTNGGIQKVKQYKIVDIWKLNVDFYESLYKEKGVKNNTLLIRGVKNNTKGGKKTYQKGVKNTPPNKNHIKQEPYKDSETSSLVVFSFKEEMEKLRTSNRKIDKIIGLYWTKKGWSFENKDQYITNYKRELKPASLLKGYSGKQIARSMEYCLKKYDIWTLETCIKRIEDVKLNYGK